MAFHSLEDFKRAVKEVLPSDTDVQRVYENLAGRLNPEAYTLANLKADEGESLATWPGPAFAGKPGEPFKLRLVIGESRTEHRGERSEWPEKMVRAASTDGALGFGFAAGLLRSAERLPADKQVDFEFLVDEWDQTPRELTESHAALVGTGEVNIAGMFLQQLLAELIKMCGESDRLECRIGDHWHRLLRSPGGGREAHPGFVLLLKNPWSRDLKTRILWFGGVTGIATSAATQLFLSLPTKHADALSKSVGVVFNTDRDKSTFDIVAWLRWHACELKCHPPNEDAGQRSHLVRDDSALVDTVIKSSRRVPKEEANVRVREDLRKNPKATIREVARRTGASQAGVCKTSAWQAHMARKKSVALNSKCSIRTTQLTDKILANIGKMNDPHAPMPLEEAVYMAYLMMCESNERERFEKLSNDEQGNALATFIEHLVESFAENNDSRRP